MEKQQRIVPAYAQETISLSGYAPPEEKQQFWCGIIKVRELPHGCTRGDFDAWWPRVSEHDRERYTAYEAHNILTLSGFAQLLTYIGSNAATTLGFAQYFAVGTFPVISVQAGDTTVLGEIYRAVPSSQTTVGNQLTLSTYFGPSSGNGLLTNAGLFGVNASATSGSGTLMTHTLYNYTKANGQAISNDYLIVLQ